MAIGNQIKALRKSLGLTQQTFADKLFISYQSVSNWERAKSHPTAEMMLTIIETFHLPLNFFMPSDQNSQDLDDEQLILAAFIKSMRASADKIPTMATIAQLAGLSIERAMAYFPTFDDLAYATINAVDDNIKTKIESRLAVEPDILTVFINDMTPLLYQEHKVLHILYTRPYIRGVWVQFLKAKYKSLLIKYQPRAAQDVLGTEYYIETLTGFISVWMSQKKPESLTDYQKRLRALTSQPLAMWHTLS
ncbi:MAG: helix-turn-helix domain-containing protein [Leuconostoc lactis]|uniref:helix-turn-helix domain-containing protein n=1 Tax=Leuconostoc lactis TaxID=1246 RepID=UPI00399613AA